MKKVLLTATVQSHIAQFHEPLIELLHRMGFEVHVAAKNNLAVKNGLSLKSPDKIFDVSFSRSPFNRSNSIAYKQLKKILSENKYDIIHCNTPMGGVLTRLASRKERKKGTKVIYTAHGFHFFKGAPLKNWLLYYPIEKILSNFTDVLITINREDYNLSKKMKSKQVRYIPGVGIDTQKISSLNISIEQKRKELGIPLDAFVIVSVGELNKNKNHEIILRALKRLNHPDTYYLICGNGKLDNHLKNLAQYLEIENNVKLLGYRLDIPEIYKAVDVFAFPSFREGLGLAAIEAMASGLPIITSNIRGITDYSKDGVTGFICEPDNLECFAENILKLKEENELIRKISMHNTKAAKDFDIEKTLEVLQNIYENFRKGDR